MSTGKDEKMIHVSGYLVRWNEPDAAGNIFTPETDFRLAEGAAPGRIRADEVGLWYEGWASCADAAGETFAGWWERKIGLSSSVPPTGGEGE